MDSIPPSVLDSILDLGISDRRVSPLIDHWPCRRYKVTSDAHGDMLTCPLLYTGYKIDSGAYMLGVALGRLALNSASNSDCLDD
jgi:hypothetical protein